MQQLKFENIWLIHDRICSSQPKDHKFLSSVNGVSTVMPSTFRLNIEQLKAMRPELLMAS